MSLAIDLNSDLGESFGPWTMGDDAGMLKIVTSANVACGGHASDPETMFATLRLARQHGVVVGAHPGYADREGFGRRVIPMAPEEIGRMIAAQVGALTAIASLAGNAVRYVKAHGALGNLAAVDRQVADAICGAVSRSGMPCRTRVRPPRFRAKDVSTCMGSPTARGSSSPSHLRREDVAFSSSNWIGTSAPIT